MSSFHKVAVLGNGNLGALIIKELVGAGFAVTVLSRNPDSLKDLPNGVEVAKVDYESPATLDAALAGHDVAISTLGMGAFAVQIPIVDACIRAGVKRFVPNHFGSFTTDPDAVAELPLMAGYAAINAHLADKAAAGVLEWTHFSVGSFTEMLLHSPLVNFAERTAKLYNHGNHPFSTTRMTTVAKAVAAALLRPDQTRNRDLFVHDCLVSQAKLVALGRRRLGGEWAITSIDGDAEYRAALEAQQKGDVGPQSSLRLLLAALLTGRFAGAYLTTDNALLGLGYVGDEELEAAIGALAV